MSPTGQEDTALAAALDTLTQAAQGWQQRTGNCPAPAQVVAALQTLEKSATQAAPEYAALVGTWQLALITGTTRSRQQMGGWFGPGRYLPHWLPIRLTYQPPAAAAAPGSVQNTVGLGLLQLTLSGPTRFWPRKSILAFDFTRLHLTLAQAALYDGPIRQGRDREAQFPTQSLKEQAFFRYFLVQPDYIAARGRGGGLALWVRAAPATE